MKVIQKIVLMAILFFSSFSAQSAVNSVEIKKEPQSLSLENPYELTLEMETNTVRDSRLGESTIRGTETFFRVEPSYKFSKQQKLSLGVDYRARSYNGHEGERESKVYERQRNHLSEIFAKYEYKYRALLGTDFRFQTRYYYNADPFYREKYGNVANVQLRNYFGRDLGAGFFVDKYVSYVRFKQYVRNTFTNDHSRDYEMRFRIAPTYGFSKDLKAGLTLTYNNIQMVGPGVEENIELGGSVRYGFNNNAAVLFMTDYTAFKKTRFDGGLKTVDRALDDVFFRLNLVTYL